jgi:Mg2+/Co2+ transporter CorB
MIVEDWLTLVAILFFLLLSAFLSAGEAALSASSPSALQRLQQQGNRRAAIACRLLASRERLFATLLLANTICRIAAVALTTAFALFWWDEPGVLLAVLAMIVCIAAADLVPKAIAGSDPERFGLMLARPIDGCVRLLGPAAMGIEALTKRLVRWAGFRLDEDKPILSAREERRAALEPHPRRNGSDKPDPDAAGSRVLDLHELVVGDVMLHRTEMITLNAEDAPAEIVRQVLTSSVTRFPLWRESPDNIVGMLHAQDVMRALQTARGDVTQFDIASVMLMPWFVPDTTPLYEQLKAFRRRRTPMALVVDEYGDLMGLVMIEDIIDEIVGDITDVRDLNVPGVRPQPDGSVNVDGSVPIRDLNRAMDWNLPDEDATTIAGLVIHESRSIPAVGQSFTFHGFRFRVLSRARNRISALYITPLARQPLA